MPGGDTIGNLTAVVSATAEQFGADMKSIQSDLDALKSKAAEVGEKVPSAFEIGASVEMFKEGVRLAQDALESFLNVFEEAEALKHSAEVIGTTTSELSALRFAAMEAGVGAETFDNALTKLTQSIGKARDGSAQQIAALDKLGLDMNKLAGEDAGTAFTDVAEALSHVPNEADRARIAVELFGKTGQQLAPMFAEGADGLDKAIEKGKELGAILTDQEVEKEAK
ncbi:MAG TPA: hypothetical protein VG056_07585, partial [Pirellulales bacterium]|nr:hypothetical protein [Pirellulales bacterium]